MELKTSVPLEKSSPMTILSCISRAHNFQFLFFIKKREPKLFVKQSECRILLDVYKPFLTSFYSYLAHTSFDKVF